MTVYHGNTPPHTAFSAKNTFRQETNKPNCFVSSNRPWFYTTTNNVVKPSNSTSHRFGIEIRRLKTYVTWLGMTSGRPRKLKILYLQSSCKLIPLIYVLIHTHAHTHVSCRTYWHFSPTLFHFMTVHLRSLKRVQKAAECYDRGPLGLAQLRHPTSHSASWTSNYAFPFI